MTQNNTMNKVQVTATELQQLLSQNTKMFCGSPLGAMEISVFWPKNPDRSTFGAGPWQYHRGTLAHRHNFFPTGEIPVT